MKRSQGWDPESTGQQGVLTPSAVPGERHLPTAEGRGPNPVTGLRGLGKTSRPNPWALGVSSPQVALGAWQARGNGWS